jgi:hypothetical protein
MHWGQLQSEAGLLPPLLPPTCPWIAKAPLGHLQTRKRPQPLFYRCFWPFLDVLGISVWWVVKSEAARLRGKASRADKRPSAVSEGRKSYAQMYLIQ